MSMIVKQAGFDEGFKKFRSNVGKHVAKRHALKGAIAGGVIGSAGNAYRAHKKNKNLPKGHKKSVGGAALKGALAGGAGGAVVGSGSGYLKGTGQVDGVKKTLKGLYGAGVSDSDKHGLKVNSNLLGRLMKKRK